MLWALVLLLWASGTAAQLAEAGTPEELAATIRSGTPHVVVTRHMDLSALPAQQAAAGQRLLFSVPAAVKSVTVCPDSCGKSTPCPAHFRR